MPAFVAYLCDELVHDYDIHVLAPHYKGAKLYEKMGDVKVFRFLYGFPSWERLAYGGGIMENLKTNKLLYAMAPIFILSQLIYLFVLNARFKYSLVHAHWLIPQGIVAGLFKSSLMNNPNIVVTSHGGDLFALNHSLLTRVKRWVLHKADHVSVVSNIMKLKCKQIDLNEKKISVLPMGVDLVQKFTPNDETLNNDTANPKNLVFVGRLVEKKGVSFLITAMSIMVKRHPDLQLIIAGDGPLRKTLEQQSHTLLLQHNINFLGSVLNTELPKLLRKASIAIIPSVVDNSGDQEGLGLVTIEAMGCGCAVVASDLPAIRDVVSHNETGLLVKPKNPNDLANNILSLIDNPKLRDKLALAGGKSVIKKYDWRNVGVAYGDMLGRLCK